MQVCVPSTPAQMFHLLRRQMLRSFRKPLIVMTPKSLLRHELSVSALTELSHNGFANVIDEIDDYRAGAGTACGVLQRQGLLRSAQGAPSRRTRRDVAIVRVEQLYPFPVDEYQAVLARYPQASELVWCQEEPQNQGAWFQIRHRLQDLAQPRTVYYAGRGAAAAPATGVAKQHDAEQRRLVETALNATSIEQSRSTPRLTLNPSPGAQIGAPAADVGATPIRKKSL